MTNNTDKDLSLQKERIWSAVFVTECIVVFIINTFTLITFGRSRHLRKRSTYLIINLTAADLLVGVVRGTLIIFGYSDILRRNLELFRWQEFIILLFVFLFIAASLVTISLISLDRLHATVYPFRHCLTGQWVYLKIIICSWLIALLLSFVLTFLFLFARVLFLYISASCIFLTLLIITVCYITIISNVKSNPHSQNSGSKLSAERKLTVTLFIVTVISFLTILPWAISRTIPSDIWGRLSPATTLLFFEMVSVLYFANFIVNPLIYAIRMEEFRKAAKELVCKTAPEPMRV